MRSLIRSISLVLALLLGTVYLSACASLHDQGIGAQPKAQPFILISIDGFRAEYLERGLTPNISALADSGAYGIMRPSFPSLTFPNHYTMVTGKVPDHHGIVASYMIDIRRPGVKFQAKDRTQATDRFWWDDATPFWVSAERSGKKVGTMFWPGSEADIQGVAPSYRVKFDTNLSNKLRVDQIISWIDLPKDQRPEAMTLYFDEIDKTGHKYGPNAPELNQAISNIDQAIGYLIAEIKKRNLNENLNLILVSDHGMTQLSKENVIYLDELMPPDWFEVTIWGEFMALNPAPGFQKKVGEILLRNHQHMNCWPKDKIPSRLHYGTHARVSQIVCSAHIGWRIVPNRLEKIDSLGGHGYDPDLKDMHAVFIGYGPAFKNGQKLQTFDNTAVYSLLMHLLKLEPEPNDGNLSPLKPALKAEK